MNAIKKYFIIITAVSQISIAQFNLVTAKQSDIVAKSPFFTLSSDSVSLYDTKTFALIGVQNLASFVITKTNVMTSVHEKSILVNESNLQQNFPNPFNSSTMIRYSVPSQTTVTLQLFDVTGREVQTLVSNEVQSGDQQVHFNNTQLSSGTYFYHLSGVSANGSPISQTKKMIVMK